MIVLECVDAAIWNMLCELYGLTRQCLHIDSQKNGAEERAECTRGQTKNCCG